MGATKVSGGRAVDYTPSGADLTAGDVVVQGELVGVAIDDIEDGRLGALSVEGIYSFPKDGGVEAIGAGALVYWDVAEGFAKTDDETGANKLIGKAVEAALIADTSVKIKLDQ
jgi:predicted RecA/RadA family phage recombinase